jgi:muconolactone delta-isomerase
MKMVVYIAERDLTGITQEQLLAIQSAAIEMSARFSAQGRPVRYLRSVYVPSEYRCISLFEAPNARLVRDVNEAAGIPFTRILEAVDLTP